MFCRRKAENGVEYDASDIITARHLFSTRAGGVSTAPQLASMNLGEERGDEPGNVEKNFDRLLAPLGFGFADTVGGKQVHSTNVRYVTAADRGSLFEDTDGFVTDCPGVVLVVKVADCVPILLCDEVSGVIAAVHAGWRGSAGGIAREAVSVMCAHGAAPENIHAALGACIHNCCFEVRSDLVDSVRLMCGDDIAQRIISHRGGRMYADLTELDRIMLLAAGVLPENIDISGECTCCRPDIYFSHRATGGRRGTMAAAIVL